MNDEMKCLSSDQTLPVVRKLNQNLEKCVEAVGRELVYQMKALHEVSSLKGEEVRCSRAYRGEGSGAVCHRCTAGE